MLNELIDDIHKECLRAISNAETKHEKNAILSITRRIEAVKRVIDLPLIRNSMETLPPPDSSYPRSLFDATKD